LETTTKVDLGTTHFIEMMIALDSYFRQVQEWYKYDLIRKSRSVILNLCPLMWKLIRLASSLFRLKKPNGCVSSPTMKCINTRDPTPHLDILHSHISISLHQIVSYIYWAASLSLSLTCCKKVEVFWAKLHNFRLFD